VGTPRNQAATSAGTPRQPPAGGVGAAFYQFVRNAAGLLLPQRLETQFTGGGVTVTDDAPNNRTIVDLSGVSAAEMFIWGALTSLQTPPPRFLFPGYAEANPLLQNAAEFLSPRAGTARNMHVYHNGVGAPATNLTYTLWVNGVATALTVTLAANAVSATDLVNTVAIAQGDRLAVRLTKAGALNQPVDRPIVSVEIA
jgi:hypothetical protein